jgi:uncharacterized protein
MTKHILFLQGAGEGAYKEDKELADSLRQALGSGYEVRYPAMPDEDNAPYEQWTQVIEKELGAMPEPIILIGHSVGGSVLAKWLGEMQVGKLIAGVFLISTPFWGGSGWLYDGYEELELPDGMADRIPKDTPVFLYHCRYDETVPFEHLALYAQVLPQATVRTLEGCGHQLNNDLSEVAKDIKSLQ